MKISILCFGLCVLFLLLRLLLLLLVKRIWKKAILSLFFLPSVHLFDGDNELFLGGFCLLIVCVDRKWLKQQRPALRDVDPPSYLTADISTVMGQRSRERL
jgi:hypothetical protein